MEYALGRQAYTLGKSDLAVQHFLRLLQRGDQSVDQAGILEDFSLAYQVGTVRILPICTRKLMPHGQSAISLET